MKTFALVPLNTLADTKSRLTKALPDAEREALALWMASRVLDALLASRRVDAVTVVSPDPAVLTWASRRGALTLRQRRDGEPPTGSDGIPAYLLGGASHTAAFLSRHAPTLESRDAAVFAPALQRRAVHGKRQEGSIGSLLHADSGLNAGLELGRRWALAGGADALLVALGDLPCLTAREVSEMVALADRPTDEAAVVLAPDRRERGTNALLVRPPWLVRFSFGAKSLARHLALARYTAVEPILFRALGTAFDVDTPADLDELAARGLWPPGEGGKSFASAAGKESLL